jgi:uncharacterized protein (DUF1499 family)
MHGEMHGEWKGWPEVAVALAAAGVLFACAGTPAGPERLPAGSLAPCPGRPNCVCSQDARPAFAIEPLTFADESAAAWARLRTILEAMGGRIERASAVHLHATFRSRIFRFVDDVEFLLDPGQGVIHVRSASRVGYSDRGVNRRRVEDLRARWNRP